MLSSTVQRSISVLLGSQPLAWQVGTKGMHTVVSQPKADSSVSSQTSLPLAFDPALLYFLVFPLSKKPLRYEMSTNELINDDLGIVCPIIDGIPNMIPQATRRKRTKIKQERAVKSLLTREMM
uniref:Uncharacterized protein n=1 Tax=Monodelphis domestica TaxID=13616 RepID=A0A5F8G3G0_MONDO